MLLQCYALKPRLVSLANHSQFKIEAQVNYIPKGIHSYDEIALADLSGVQALGKMLMGVD